jgi:hypothetical protein
VRGHPLAKLPSQVSFYLDETFPAATSADEAVQNFCRVLQHYNQHSERFEFIDHILLRPHPSEHEFRRILLRNDGTLWMQHAVPTTLSAIGSEPVSLEGFGMKPCQLSPEASAPWHVCLGLLTRPEAAKAFLSIKAFPTEATARAAMEQWSPELSRLPNEHAFQASFQPWKPNAPVPSDPYSFQATLLVPTWPTRFQQPATRRLIHQLVHREAPAHLRVHVAWLDHRAFQQFNRLLLAWKQAHQDQPTRTRQATADLRRFIARLHP